MHIAMKKVAIICNLRRKDEEKILIFYRFFRFDGIFFRHCFFTAGFYRKSGEYHIHIPGGKSGRCYAGSHYWLPKAGRV